MALENMDIYVVGGYVRDQLLGLDPKDVDFVVVHATVEDLLEFGVNVGLQFQRIDASFPVFLDQHKREWAFARRERKVRPGYHGFEVEFDPSVTIEEDLRRRDLTINAMAREVTDVYSDGEFVVESDVIDPYGGRDDLDKEILRHVSEAFAEDPVRVLRLARFKARNHFKVAAETRELVQHMCEAGELDHLTPERVWREMEKALEEEYPNLFFYELSTTEAFDTIFPVLAREFQYTNKAKRVLNVSGDMVERVAILVSHMALSDAEHVCFNEVKMPTDVAKFAVKYNRLHRYMTSERFRTADNVERLFRELDLYRDKYFLDEASSVTLNFTEDDDLNDVVFDLLSLYNLAKIHGYDDLSDEQKESLRGPGIGQAINDLRKEVIAQALEQA